MKKKNKQYRIYLYITILFVIFAGLPTFSYGVVNIDSTATIANGTTAGKVWESSRKGIYSTWDKPKSGFSVPKEYANIISKGSQSKGTSFGKTCSPDTVRNNFGKDYPTSDFGANMNEDNSFCFDIKSNTPGNCGVLYENYRIYDTVKKDYVMLDIKGTITGWKDETDKTPNSQYICIQNNGRPWINLAGMEETTIKFEYYLADTTTPYIVKSNLTYDDVDNKQYIAFKAAQIQNQFAAANTRLDYAYEGGNNIYHNREAVNYPNGDSRNAFGANYQTDSLTFTYGTKKGGTWTNFGYLSYVMANIEPNDPVKTVSDSNEKEVNHNTLSTPNETFTYQVSELVPTGYSKDTWYTNFTISDTLEPILTIIDAKVLAGSSDVSGDFDIKITGQKVMAAAKQPTLQKDSFYGKEYKLVITAKLNKSAKITPYLSTDGKTISWPNTGTVTINDKPMVTNKVNTDVHLPTRPPIIPPDPDNPPNPDDGTHKPGLAISKKVSRYEWQVGDVIDYTIKVWQTNKKATAVDVIITDNDLPDELEIDAESYSVDGIENHKVKVVKGGFELSVPELPYGKIIEIKFKAKARKALNGTIIPNTATAKAWAVPDQSASAGIYINSPKLKLNKTAHKSTYKKEETIGYTLTLAQMNKGCFMRDIIIKDEIKTKGVRLLPGSIQVTDSNDKVINHECKITIKDNQFTIETQKHLADQTGRIPPKEAKMTPYSNLELETRFNVTYDVVVVDESLVNGKIKNVAVAPATPNTDGDMIKDDPEIPSGGDNAEHLVNLEELQEKTPQTPDKISPRTDDISKTPILLFILCFTALLAIIMAITGRKKKDC